MDEEDWAERQAEGDDVWDVPQVDTTVWRPCKNCYPDPCGCGQPDPCQECTDGGLDGFQMCDDCGQTLYWDTEDRRTSDEDE